MRALVRNVSLTAGIVLAGALGSARAADGEREFEIYGFVMSDFIHDFQRLDPAVGRRVSSVEDLHRRAIRQRRPVEHQRQAEPLRRERHDADGRRQSPINFKFEFDLFGTGVDAGQTTFRLRHAYGEWGSLLAGQTNSLFMDGDMFPNTIDYWGPTGMVFYRNVQIRWTPFKHRQQSLRHRHRAAGQRHRPRQHPPDREASRTCRSRTTKNCRTSRRNGASAATGATSRSAASCARSDSRAASTPADEFNRRQRNGLGHQPRLRDQHFR